MWKLWPEKELVGWYEPKLENARSCVECGDCEEACPYNLPIRDMLVEGLEFIDSKIG
jgi:predicted aldo/keto reductase-like oxidoreductase